MTKTSGTLAIATLIAAVSCTNSHAQSAPPLPDKVWHSSTEQSLAHELAMRPEAKYDIDSHKTYTLAQLIDLAQEHNPDTRVAWEEAKARAASLGIARSALFPT